jgi:hypothetical protein
MFHSLDCVKALGFAGAKAWPGPKKAMKAIVPWQGSQAFMALLYCFGGSMSVLTGASYPGLFFL